MKPIRNADLATLGAEDLFAALTTLSTNNAKAKAGRKPKGKAKPPAKAPEPRIPLILRTPWDEEALVLIVTRQTCACCGAESRVPNRRPLLRRRSKLLGTHSIAVDFPEWYAHLPHEIEYIDETIPSCDRCFNLEGTIEAGRERKCCVQLGLPFKEEVK